MHDKLAKLMAKKKGRPMDDLEKEAKMSVVKDLSNAAADAMRGKLSGLKKVTVASDSKEGLTKGLEKAEEIVSGAPEMKEGEEEKMVADAEDGEGRGEDLFAGGEEEGEQEHMGDEEAMSEEEIDQKLAELMAKKQRMQAKKA